MKRGLFHFFPLIILATAFSGHSQTGIIPPDRRIDWTTAGIPGGIPSRTTVYATINATTYGNGTTDAAAAIQGAIDAAPSGQVVFLPAGTYLVKTTVHLRSNKTLRGAGMGKTVILFPDSSSRSILDMRGLANWDITGQKRTTAITGGLTKGSSQLTLASIGAIAVGDILLIDQLNDTTLVDPVGFEGLCSYCGRENGTRVRGQFVEVTAINGNQVTTNLPLYWTLSAALSPQATLVNASSMVRRAGIEDLTITESAPAVEFMVEMDAAQYSWLKNVEMKRIRRRAVWLIESLQNEIRECYFHDAIGGFGRDRGYCVLADAYATANLIENNIFHTADGGFMMAAGGASGNVFGYNYMTDARFDDGWWLTAAPAVNHAPHPSMNLWEGNIGVQAGADFIHGSSSHNTLFRNRFTGWQHDTITSNNNAIELQYKNRYYNVLGCVLGTTGKSSTYEAAYPASASSSLKLIWRLGYGGPSYIGETQVRTTLLRHGNFDYVTQATRWDSTLADHHLPVSLYRSSKPAWWGSLPWPAIGPDSANPTVLLNNKIPAEVRYEDGGISLEAIQKFRVAGFALEVAGLNPWRIRYQVPEAGVVSVKIYDVAGKCLQTLLAGRSLSGSGSLIWHPRGIAPGVYFVSLSAGNSRLAVRAVFLD